MLLLLFLQSTFYLSDTDFSMNPLKHPTADEKYQFQQTNTTIPESVNQTLINEIRELMNEILDAIKDFKVGSKNINESLQYLRDQIESPNSSLSIETLTETLNWLEELTKGYSNEINNLVSKTVNKIMNEIQFLQEIVVNYVPKRYTRIVRRSDIKPITEPITQDFKFSNFTFETRRPYAAKKIIFDSYINPGNSSTAEANLHFYLKGRINYSHERCILNVNDKTTFEFSQPVLFDKLIIQCLKNNGDNDSYTIPTFHLFEPKRIRN